MPSQTYFDSLRDSLPFTPEYCGNLGIQAAELGRTDGEGSSLNDIERVFSTLVRF